MRPRRLEGTCAGPKLTIALGQLDDRFARLRYQRDERKLEALVGQNRDAAPQAENRVEHGTDPIRQAATERVGIFQRATPAQELGAVGFELDRVTEGG
jgi:hypothetical protein